MKDTIKQTLDKIRERGIRPEPRWKYLLKRYVLWTAFCAVVLSGAASFSIAFDLLVQLDWDLHRFVHQSALLYSLSLFPYFWIAAVGLFLVLAFLDLRGTETGYRYSRLKISFASIGGVVALGLIFALVGLGGKANAILAKDIPYYGEHLVVTKESQWMRPDSGFLAGSLGSISGDELGMTDLSGKKWTVLLDEKTLIRPAVDIVQGETVKIIGEKKSADHFRAVEIRPWMGKGGMGGSGKGPGGAMGNGGGQGMMRGR